MVLKRESCIYPFVSILKQFFSTTFFQRKKKAMRGAAPHAAYFDQRQSRQNASLKRREGLEWVLKVVS